MCFGLSVATGSFFLGQMKFIPEPVRIVPPLLVLAFAPIVFLIYWMWRVRGRGRLTGRARSPSVELRAKLEALGLTIEELRSRGMVFDNAIQAALTRRPRRA
jgi:hypothetical protein